MESAYPTSPLFVESKGKPVRWTSRTVSDGDSIYVTAVPDEEEDQDVEDIRPVVTLATMITVTDPFLQETLSPLPTGPTTRTTMMAAETTPRNASSFQPTSSSPVNSDAAAPLTSTDPNSRGLSEPIIGAIAIGTALALMAMGMIAWAYIRRRRSLWNQNNTAIPRHNPTPILRPPSPPALPELSSHADSRTDTPSDSLLSWRDPRETLSQGVRSPTPQPAVAEVRSFTRAWQKPRVYTVGRDREPPEFELVGSPLGRNHASSPISPMSGMESTYMGSHAVSPLSPPSRYGSLSPWAGEGRGEDQRRRY